MGYRILHWIAVYEGKFIYYLISHSVYDLQIEGV